MTLSMGEKRSLKQQSTHKVGDWPFKNIKKQELLEVHRQHQNLMGPYPTIPPILNERVQKTLAKLPFKVNQEAATTAKKPKTIESSNGKSLIFSRLEFEENEPSLKKKGKRSRLPKDPNQALKKIEQRKKQLEDLRNIDQNAAKEREERDRWNKALDRAQGVAVRDNPAMLKKTLKRKEKEKEKGKKRWKEIKDNELKQAQKKQEKRKENIMARKEAQKKKRRNK